MAFAKFVFKPGINKEGTNFSNENGWFDSDKIRFRKGRPEKIGGWQKHSVNTFQGTCRKIHIYKDIEQSQYKILGTHKKLYGLQGNVYNDITPIRSTTSAGDVTFAATNGSSTITATDTSHGAVKGDFVTFSGAATLGGLIIHLLLQQKIQTEKK